MKRVLAALAASTCIVASAQAAEINRVPDYSDAISMEGFINSGDEFKLLNVLKYRSERNLATTYLVLNSGGGNLLSSARMAELIRDFKIRTIVPSSGECSSACMLMFAAGTERIAWTGARLGVHNASLGNEDSGSGTVALAKEMAYYGTPAQVIALMVVTPSTDITWLKDRDVQGWVQIMENDPTPTAYAPTAPSAPVAESISMTCFNDKLGSYTVSYAGDDELRMKDRVYPASSSVNAKTNALVVKGPTKYGTYGAVFGGPRPRIEYVAGKEHVIDRCY